MKVSFFSTCAKLCLCFVAAAAVVRAEPYETIVSNGDAGNRIDMVVVGDGYTADELGKYRTDVAQLIERMFRQDPYREYQTYFNVHRIDVTSAQSGADHPDRNPQVYVNTAFDATYNCAGTRRLICVNQTRVREVARNTLAANQYDMIVVLVNDPEYGGSGGSVAVGSTHPQVVELVLHELGHSFGFLADEYDYGGGRHCSPPSEPSAVNSTIATTRENVKWNHWIDAATSLPTIGTTPGVPGLYQGSSYCESGYYRPTHDSKMRSLGVPFEQINLEQHIRRIYTFVSPLDTVAPLATNITINYAQAQTFSVTTPQPATHNLEVTWLVDGVSQATGATFVLPARSLASGTHTVEVVVRDATDDVRRDPQGLLEERRSWTLSVASKRRTTARPRTRN